MTRQQRAGEWAENVYFKLVARISIIIASTIGLPLSFFVLQQVYGSYKTMQATQGTIVTTIQLIKQEAESQTRENERRFGRIETDVTELKDNQRRYLFRVPQ